MEHSVDIVVIFVVSKIFLYLVKCVAYAFTCIDCPVVHIVEILVDISDVGTCIVHQRSRPTFFFDLLQRRIPCVGLEVRRHGLLRPVLLPVGLDVYTGVVCVLVGLVQVQRVLPVPLHDAADYLVDTLDDDVLHRLSAEMMDQLLDYVVYANLLLDVYTLHVLRVFYIQYGRRREETAYLAVQHAHLVLQLQRYVHATVDVADHAETRDEEHALRKPQYRVFLVFPGIVLYADLHIYLLVYGEIHIHVLNVVFAAAYRCRQRTCATNGGSAVLGQRASSQSTLYLFYGMFVPSKESQFDILPLVDEAVYRVQERLLQLAYLLIVIYMIYILHIWIMLNEHR